MTAGTGVLHSEYSSPTDKTHLLQIWILPEKQNLQPGYEQKIFPVEEKQGKLRLVASRGGDDGSVHINQDVKLYASILSNGEEVSLDLAEGATPGFNSSAARSPSTAKRSTAATEQR
jgi:quercetin 2,3-dioxygenase